MSDSDVRGARGIEIAGDVAAAAGMPADLDANSTAPFMIPDLAQRRTAGHVYVVGAVGGVGAAVGGLGVGYWLAAALLVMIAGYHYAASKKLVVSEIEALELANKRTNFAVGHASAALGFDGILARPVWNVLVFSADDPPSQRGLVRVDALQGSIIEQYVEPITE